MPRHLHRLPRLLAILLTCALSLPALAAPPPVINYQGYLADSDSAPISEMLLISFAIYDVPGGGAPLWSETQLVAVDGGLFNVKLGASIPLPADVASAPRYLGITVESDAEMVPRQEIASSMFAFAAADAELLGGAPASDYDQSAHVGATGNPHSVTASEVGAATPADITAHAGDAAAHHAPYTDGQAVAAILANDGTGSGLDADSVDGLSAGAFLQPGSDFGRPGVAGQLFEGNQTLTNLYVNEGQLNSIAGEMILDGSIGQLDIATNGVGAAEIAAGAVGSAEIAPGAVGISELASDSVTPSKINWSLNHADSDLNGGLISVQNTSDGTPGNFPMGLSGAVSGSSGASGTLIGVAGLSPGLGLGAPVSDLPVGTKYGVVGVVDIGTAVAAITNSGIGLYADGTTMATKGIGANGPTVGYSGVQGTTNFDGNAAVDINGFEIGLLGVSTGTTVSDNFGVYGVSNNVGVFGAAPNLAGEFVGDVQIGRQGEMRLTGPQLIMRAGEGDNTIILDATAGEGTGLIEAGAFNVTGGSDLSENFNIVPSVGSSIEPGTVVSIDPASAGQLVVSAEAYDRKVAGIVSGAGGVRPGMTMGQRGSIADGEHPVALTGRVYVRADASHHAIQPGDLLTTSALPGYAMRVVDFDRAPGAIIGKAMTALESGTGLVLVLVTLQ